MPQQGGPLFGPPKMKPSRSTPPPETTTVHPADPNAPSTHQEEWRSFLFLTVITAPVLAVAVVGGWGFIVWMYQLLTGHLPGGA